jgi:2-oxoglutarate ferredoxin oxidoreductase subunit beta
VTFNKVNTYEWYQQRVYHLEPEYNPEDRTEAFRRSLEWGDRIPLGIFFKNSRPAYEKRISVIQDTPLVRQSFDSSKVEATMKEFY